MQRWQCLINNGTLETLIWSKMWKIPSFFYIENYLFLINKKCASHFLRETSIKINSFKKQKHWNSFRIRQSCQGYRCKSGIAIVALRPWLKSTLTVPLNGKVRIMCLNLMNLNRVSNPPQNRFQLSVGWNLESLNTILSGTNHIWAAAQIL